jgi:hypothetical protein
VRKAGHTGGFDDPSNLPGFNAAEMPTYSAAMRRQTSSTFERLLKALMRK